MPIKVKKNKKVIKQKQKQSQRQVVNIKIGEVKKAVVRRKGNKKPDAKPIIQQSVQPVQYLYQSTGSIPQFQNMGVAQQPRPNLLGGAILQPEDVREVREQALSQEARRQIEEVQQAVLSAEEQLQRSREALRIGRDVEPRPSVLGGGFFPSEEVARQRVLRLDTPLRLRQPEEFSLYGDFPSAEVINTENPLLANFNQEVDVEPLQFEEEEEPMLAGGGAVSGSAFKRRYNYKDGYGTKDQLIEQIIDMNMGYTEELLKRRYNSRVKLIVLLDDLRRGKKL